VALGRRGGFFGRKKKKKWKEEKGKYERLEKIQTVEQPLSEYSRHGGHVSKVWPEPRPRVNISRSICLQKSYKERTTRQVFLSETFQKAIFKFLRSRNGAEFCSKFVEQLA